MNNENALNDKWFKLLVCVVLCLGVGWIGGLFTEQSIDNWYLTLVKPPWTPPNVVFPLVWTILYFMMAVSLWYVWTSHTANKKSAFIIFGIQLFLNFIWSWLFFSLERPLYGLLDITLLWVAIVATMVFFWRHSRTAVYLLVPYLLWVSYAYSLNLYIWMYN